MTIEFRDRRNRAVDWDQFYMLQTNPYYALVADEIVRRPAGEVRVLTYWAGAVRVGGREYDDPANDVWMYETRLSGGGSTPDYSRET